MTLNLKNKSAALATAALLALPAACTPGADNATAFTETDKSGWAYPDALKFNLEHHDSIATGQLHVAVRHTAAYLYSNLWVEVKTLRADSTVVTDTVNIPLADIYGNWTGKGSGVWKQVEVPVGVPFRHRSGHEVRVRHIMRVDTLHHIDMVGVKFTLQNK